MRAVTFDFYETLVRHGAGVGRGQRFREHLAAHGATSDPWEHRVLYDVFEYYDAHYETSLSAADKAGFWIEFTRRLFERTGVSSPGPVDYAEHAEAIRGIMGPGCFAVYDDVIPAMEGLAAAGLRLGVVSDWPKGLRPFCDELGIGDHLDVVVASADAGFEKPDPRLFEIARRELGVAAGEILHVGDRDVDVEGASASGFSAVLIVRGGEAPPVDAPVISTLLEVRGLV